LMEIDGRLNQICLARCPPAQVAFDAMPWKRCPGGNLTRDCVRVRQCKEEPPKKGLTGITATGFETAAFRPDLALFPDLGVQLTVASKS